VKVPRPFADWQKAFADALSSDDDADLVRRLAGDPALARRRLAIYRRAVAANAIAALRSAYPVIVRLVGEAFFDEAGRRYMATSPPRCADLNRYGDGFPAFLEGYLHAVTLPWLGDVARLEWAWHEALMAADADALDLAALARVPEAAASDIRFEIHPSVRVVRSLWPILAIWEANQPQRDGTAERDEGHDIVLVWRGHAQVQATLLTDSTATFLERLRSGLTLGVASEVPGEWDLPETLRSFAAYGVLCGFRTPSKPA
jgi:hypothetical protein